MTKTEEYNSPSREIACKLLVYFGEVPLEINKSNYLIDLDILEEAGASSSNPFGVLSSNELSFDLYNTDGIFSPTNVQSIYYGKIRKGVKVEVFFKINEQETWDPCGIFYVSSWQAAITSFTVTVLAHDILSDVFNRPLATYYIKEDVPYKEFIAATFSGLSLTAEVHPDIQGQMAYAYTTGTTHECLAQVTQAAGALCICNKSGHIEVLSLSGQGDVKYTLTDEDQVIDIKSGADAILSYDGAKVTYGIPSLQHNPGVLSIRDFVIPSGKKVHDTLLFTEGLVYIPTELAFDSQDKYPNSLKYEFTPKSLVLTSTNNDTEDIQGNLNVDALVLKVTQATVSVSGDKELSITNKYINSPDVADKYLKQLINYIGKAVPVLTLKIRGNPLLCIGDKILVTSLRYGISFTGILFRTTLVYNGGLTSEIVLLDASILEVPNVIQ